jgi:hypothetical protein
MPHPSRETTELLDRFRQKIIGHPLLKSAYLRIMNLIEEPADVEVAALIGPTGAGKSTLLDRVKQGILKKNVAAMEANPGLKSMIAVDAPGGMSIELHPSACLGAWVADLGAGVPRNCSAVSTPVDSDVEWALRPVWLGGDDDQREQRDRT